MLCLTRRKGETIVIGPVYDVDGNECEITVTIGEPKRRDNKVMLQFVAPRSVNIYRQEIGGARCAKAN